MGSGSFDASAYRSYSASTAGKTAAQVFTARSINKNLDPLGVKIRESRDSADNPKSTPLIISVDVTGSMGIIAEKLARKGLGTIFEEVLDKKPISNPHLMFMATGDANSDEAPLQVSQFEADNRIVEQLTQIWVEGNGGGNGGESYNLAWYFAGVHTEHDSFIKRAKRGYLFTVGDEPIHDSLSPDQLKRFIGDNSEAVSSAEALRSAERLYDVYHIVLKNEGYAKTSLDSVLSTWRPLLGEKVICLGDYDKLSETIVSIIEVAEGQDAKKSAARFGSVVLDAVAHLPSGPKTKRLALA